MEKSSNCRASRSAENTKIYGLRTEDLINPIGIDSKNPRFSWKMSSDKTGAVQTAYQITVKDGAKTVWDSGKTEDDRSVGIKYNGEPLCSSREYRWLVSVWDGDSNKLCSEEARFETGLLEAAAWSDAIWISCSEEEAQGEPLAAYRKPVLISKPLRSAKLYTSALGVYESYINGERVGRLKENGETVYDELKPGFTEPSGRKFYSSYDITHMLKPGENVISAVVSSGWYTGGVVECYKGKKTAYLAKLVLSYSDGTGETISTDTSWKCAKAAPLRCPTGIYDGEFYDASADTSYMLPGFECSTWENATESTEFSGIISAWRGSPVRVRDDLERKAQYFKKYTSADIIGASEGYHGTIAFKAENIFSSIPTGGLKLSAGEALIIDFGQNGAGWERFELEAAAGTVVTVKHSEALCESNGSVERGNCSPEGGLYFTSNRAAAAKTTYIARGAGIEAYHPTHTFYGFRYAEISATENIILHSIAAQTVTSVEVDTGKIQTDSSEVNQLISNVKWSMYSNFLSVPTDCPQRNERQGWTGDIQIFAQTASYLGFSKSFLMKYMDDIRDALKHCGQTAFPSIAPNGIYGNGFGATGWADAGIIIPYLIYAMYGDIEIVRENWDIMTGHMLYLEQLGPFGKLEAEKMRMLIKYCGHLSLELNADIWSAAGTMDNANEKLQTSIAYYAYDARLMAEMAAALGKAEEAEKYEKIYQQQKAYYIKNFVNSNGTIKSETQQSCLFALFTELLPDKQAEAAVKKQLTDNIAANGGKLQTGFLGTGILMPTLTSLGRSDLAYSLLLNREYPSWLYSVNNNATTIWERWDTFVREIGWNRSGMNSLNHYAYGCVAGWLFESAAGIGYDRRQPGFKHISFCPHPDSRLKSVSAEYDSAYGKIKAAYLYSEHKLSYKIAVPANTSSTVTLPACGNSSNISVNGKAAEALSLAQDGIEFSALKDGKAVFNTVSGEFSFAVTA